MASNTWKPSVYYSALYAETLLHGMYTVLFGLTMYQLFRRPKPFKPIGHLFATVSMYFVATAHSIICLREAYTSLSIIDGFAIYTNSVSSRAEYTKLALEVVNCVFGDMIVIWRAWTMAAATSNCRYFRILCFIPIGLLISSAAVGIVMVFTASQTDFPSAPAFKFWVTSWLILNLVTNATVPAIIGYEMWNRNHVKNIRVVGGPISSALVLPIQSGVLYCATFAVLLALFLTDIEASYIMNHTIVQIAGIYPTLNLIFVVVGRSNPTPFDSAVDMSRRERMISDVTRQRSKSQKRRSGALLRMGRNNSSRTQLPNAVNINVHREVVQDSGREKSQRFDSIIAMEDRSAEASDEGHEQGNPSQTDMKLPMDDDWESARGMLALQEEWVHSVVAV